MDVKDLRLSPEEWRSLLVRYGISENSLTGKGAPCPLCGGNDRFTFGAKPGSTRKFRGDWVCRGCPGTNGKARAGDALQLIVEFTGMSFRQLMNELDPRRDVVTAVRADAASSNRGPAPGSGKAVDREWIERRLNAMWSKASPMASAGLGMRYLCARVPGLDVAPSKALRLANEEYFHDRKSLGRFPTILQRFVLPDESLGTLHRTYLDREQPRKAMIVSSEGEILDPKKNDKTLNPLSGGAVRLMDPVDGEIAVAEGLENAYAGYMEIGVPAWNCLNRILLQQFVVPEGLGIRTVHLYADFDNIDPKTKQSPGMAAALVLAKRLRQEGFTVFIHRPRVRGTDFTDQWVARCQGVQMGASFADRVRSVARPAHA
jgi:putative DNA primase/helicase